MLIMIGFYNVNTISAQLERIIIYLFVFVFLQLQKHVLLVDKENWSYIFKKNSAITISVSIFIIKTENY